MRTELWIKKEVLIMRKLIPVFILAFVHFCYADTNGQNLLSKKEVFDKLRSMVLEKKQEQRPFSAGTALGIVSNFYQNYEIKDCSKFDEDILIFQSGICKIKKKRYLEIDFVRQYPVDLFLFGKNRMRLHLILYY